MISTRAMVYDECIFHEIYEPWPKETEHHTKKMKLNDLNSLPHNTAETRVVRFHRNGAEEHHITRDDNNRIVAIFTRNLKTGVAKL